MPKKRDIDSHSRKMSRWDVRKQVRRGDDGFNQRPVREQIIGLELMLEA